MILPSVYNFVQEHKLDSYMDEYMALNEARGRNPVIDGKEISESEIIKAVRNRKYVGIFYEEEDDPDLVLSGFRLIEPYVYGRGYVHRDGTSVHHDRGYLRAYVIRSTGNSADIDWKGKTNRKSVSKTQRVPYWRLFRFDRIKEWTEMPYKVTAFRELYNPDDKMIAGILASADKSTFRSGEKKITLPRELRKKLNQAGV